MVRRSRTSNLRRSRPRRYMPARIRCAGVRRGRARGSHEALARRGPLAVTGRGLSGRRLPRHQRARLRQAQHQGPRPRRDPHRRGLGLCDQQRRRLPQARRTGRPARRARLHRARLGADGTRPDGRGHRPQSSRNPVARLRGIAVHEPRVAGSLTRRLHFRRGLGPGSSTSARWWSSCTATRRGARMAQICSCGSDRGWRSARHAGGMPAWAARTEGAGIGVAGHRWASVRGFVARRRGSGWVGAGVARLAGSPTSIWRSGGVRT
jgi:hypothetical protein